MKKVLVLGKTGQLAQELQEAASDWPGLQLAFVGRDLLDLTNPKFAGMINVMLKELQPFTVINAVAYTGVDKAGEEPQLANQVNAHAVGELAQACAKLRIPLVHLSTDFVFNGNSNRPYKPADLTDPLGEYGQSKLAGEQAMIESGCQGAIVRTSWLYSSYGHNFVKTIRRLASERDEIKVIAEQVGSPTYANDLAQVLLNLVANTIDKPAQGLKLYHYANAGVASWYDLASAVVELSGFSCQVIPIPVEEYPLPAPRPYYSVLDSNEITQLLSIEKNHWRVSLAECLNKINAATVSAVSS
jgi:dTDP-4-dehydrorhamnose reductase